VVERRIAALGALGPVAGRVRVDQARVARAQVVRAEAEPVGDALAEVLHEHVGDRGEPVHDLARLGLLEIEREALLVAVVRLEVEVQLGLLARDRDDPTARVAAFLVLELDHLGAEVAEHRARHRTLLPDGPVDHAQAFERHRHRESSSVRTDTLGPGDRGFQLELQPPAGQPDTEASGPHPAFPLGFTPIEVSP
jgi:hypothetical protein